MSALSCFRLKVTQVTSAHSLLLRTTTRPNLTVRDGNCGGTDGIFSKHIVCTTGMHFCSQPISLTEHFYKWIVTKKNLMCECFRLYNNAFTVLTLRKRQRFRGSEEGVGPRLRHRMKVFSVLGTIIGLRSLFG